MTLITNSEIDQVVSLVCLVTVDRLAGHQLGTYQLQVKPEPSNLRIEFNVLQVDLHLANH